MMSSAPSRPRVSPAGRPPPPPRVLRSHGMALGMALVAALDEPPSRPTLPTFPTVPTIFQRPRSDSTLSSDTFDGIYGLGDDDVGSVDVDDVDMDDLTADANVIADTLDHVEVFGRASDLERLLLLTGDADEPTACDDMDEGAHDHDEDAAEVLAHLTTLDAQPQCAPRPSGFCVLRPHDGHHIVVHAGANTAMVAALPPREHDKTRRIHQRTFGERTGAFRFCVATPTSPVKASASRTTTTARARPKRRPRSLFGAAADDIAHRHNAERVLVEDKVAAVFGDSSMSMNDRTMGGIVIETEGACTIDSNGEIKRETNDCVLSPVRSSVNLPSTTTTSPFTSDAFQTPLRPTTSSIIMESSYLTPSVSTVDAFSSSTATTSISPTPAFDKLAVVHATDTRGRIDKFEWTVRAASQSTINPQSTATITTTTATLPPPYLGDAADANRKRRVHTSTFGSFARSFSFPTNDLA